MGFYVQMLELGMACAWILVWHRRIGRPGHGLRSSLPTPLGWWSRPRDRWLLLGPVAPVRLRLRCLALLVVERGFELVRESSLLVLVGMGSTILVRRLLLRGLVVDGLVVVIVVCSIHGLVVPVFMSIFNDFVFVINCYQLLKVNLEWFKQFFKLNFNNSFRIRYYIWITNYFHFFSWLNG